MHTWVLFSLPALFVEVPPHGLRVARSKLLVEDDLELTPCLHSSSVEFCARATTSAMGLFGFPEQIPSDSPLWASVCCSWLGPVCNLPYRPVWTPLPGSSRPLAV